MKAIFLSNLSRRLSMIFSVVFASVLLLTLPIFALAAKGGVPGKPDIGGETVGNNLSFPVIWAEGVDKPLNGTAPGIELLEGEWWYWWATSGTDPNIIPLSCPPDTDNQLKCDDGISGSETGPDPGEGWVKAYLQKDAQNIWQAGSDDWSLDPITVDWIDWGDNLESVDWYTRSQVRTEVVLYQDLDPATPLTEFEMRHVSGWGIDEVHGLAVGQNGNGMTLDGTQATVYSPCARLTIQKLLYPREDPLLEGLMWDTTDRLWIVDGLVNEPIFNSPVYAGVDGPGDYGAEINVKGKVIFGYTWNVRKLNDFTENGGEAAGDYRITFSFDPICGTDSSGATVYLNTFFNPADGDDPGTQMLIPLDGEATGLSEEGEENTGGAVGIIDFDNNLTYIDVRILQRTGGGKGGKQ